MIRLLTIPAIIGVAFLMAAQLRDDHASVSTSGQVHTNKLIHETSPYLLQHAHNPVNWYPWGEEAFEEARRRQVPIFLSIGYSTCYWCHVMERESFENEEIARFLNENFVCIKVDREERPDIDDIYMAAVQILNGSGGWPMSVWLTPPDSEGKGGLKPIYAGTYFPGEPGRGMPSLVQVCQGVLDAWNNNNEAALQQADEITKRIRISLAGKTNGTPLDLSIAEAGVNQLLSRYDKKRGGFGGAPKFPQPVFLELLIEAENSKVGQAQAEKIQEAVKHTLDGMALGGMYDQVGGGFHRYSTDAKWLVPHFEKMLYDNAQLAKIYAESAERTGDIFHARVARQTLDYVLREMTDPAGGFYSAQDAEVNSHEGENYLWNKKQIRDLLAPEDAEFIIHVFGLDQGTNFHDPHDTKQPASNVLFLSTRPEDVAKEMKINPDVFLKRLDYCRGKMLEARNKRDQPRRDDKVIAAWNGLMIRGLVAGGTVLKEERYIDAARKAADFIINNMIDSDG
ncbi:MAG TPA: thioredoxin domain-containing protein, partial [Phycisphaeraceae bacterium]|nr:thioredoxin domain-containing protein [Phycisphaeraceae bacterium]